MMNKIKLTKLARQKSASRPFALAALLAVALTVVPTVSAHAAPYRHVSSYWSLQSCLSAKHFARIGDRPPTVIQKCKRDDGFPGYDWKYFTVLVYPDGNPWR